MLTGKNALNKCIHLEVLLSAAQSALTFENLLGNLRIPLLSLHASGFKLKKGKEISASLVTRPLRCEGVKQCPHRKPFFF